MRILHILDHSIPLHSGYTFRTAAILREQRALGWETFHLTSPKQGSTSAEVEEVDGLRFYRTPVPPAGPAGINEYRLIRATEARLEALARELRPDVLHAHSPVLNAIPAIRVGRRLGIPVVYEIRAFWEDAAVDHGTTAEGSVRYRATRALETWAIKRVNHVFTICEGLRRDIVARGVPDAKVTVIPNAVDVDNFQFSASKEAAQPLRQALGLEGKTVLGFVGSFYAYEGLDLLLDAFPRLLASRPDLRVLLVGGGPQDANLKAQAERLGVADKVIFTGRVPHASVSRYYDLIDLLIYPRHSMRLTELVTPLKPLEAMAQGHLFVASDVGGHKELIRDGETGRLFAAGKPDALVAAANDMLDHRDNWPAMRAAGRRFVEDVRNWKNSVSNYARVYGALTGGAGSAGRVSVLMSGPLPPAVGGMASVLGALGESSLAGRVGLGLFETGKTTPEGRPLWQGILNRVNLMRDWWSRLGAVEVAHIHTCSGLTFFLDGVLLMLARLRGVSTVLHVHGARFDDFLDGLSAPARVAARWIARRASRVIVLSEDWHRRLATRLPGARLVVVANGVPPGPRARTEGEGGEPLFLFLGNLGQRKGVPVILDAVALAARPWRIALAGGEEEPGFMAWTRAEVERRGLASRIEVLGPVVGAAKNDWLARASGFVLPSLAEGLPMALLEAMAAELPVVVTAVGAMPEVVRDGVEGRLVPPADAAALARALDDLAVDPELRRRMGEAACRTCIDGFGIERMVDALLAVYADLLPGKGLEGDGAPAGRLPMHTKA